MMRNELELEDEFKKDVAFEEILSLMNSSLHKAEKKLVEKLPEQFPTVHIIGAPRSGTTLAVQLLADNLEVGYINNLIAAFWKAPLFGIVLSKKLLDSKFESDYNSRFGRTECIKEPHEFGYFWNYHLKYDDFKQRNKSHEKTIEWGNLSKILKNMCRVYEKPMIFKSFLLGFHAEKMFRELRKSCFVYIRRDAVDNAMSLLKVRRQYIGDVDEWGSVKPQQYAFLKDQDRYVQVLGQVLFIEYEYFKQLNKLPESNKLIVDYHDLCRRTGSILEDVNRLINNQYRGGTELSVDNFTSLNFNKYNRDNIEVKKLRQAQRFLLSEFPELNDLIESRNKNSIN